MSKAFLFDMDGVLADTENAWLNAGYDKVLIEHFGQDLYKKVEIDSGMSIKGIFDAYVSAGFEGDYADFDIKNSSFAKGIYPVVPLTVGIEDLVDHLSVQGYKLGVVSSSPREWIDLLLKRLSNHSKFELILSDNLHKTLRPKPAPDPYLHAMTRLGATPEETWILEDSYTGITSAKASGAKVICFTAYQNRYKTRPTTPYYASSMAEVRQIVDKSDKA